MAIVSVVAEIVNRNVNQLRHPRAANDAEVEWASEKLRENCDDVETHQDIANCSARMPDRAPNRLAVKSGS
jgi:hypothetical protein